MIWIVPINPAPHLKDHELATSLCPSEMNPHMPDDGMNWMAWYFISLGPVKWGNSNQTLKCFFLLLKTFLNGVVGYFE